MLLTPTTLVFPMHMDGLRDRRMLLPLMRRVFNSLELVDLLGLLRHSQEIWLPSTRAFLLLSESSRPLSIALGENIKNSLS